MSALQQDQGLKEALHQCKVLAFDVDGTLTDSIDQIITCFQRTFTYAGLPVPTPEAIKGTIGMSLPLGIQSLLPDTSNFQLGAEITQLYRDTFTVSKDIHETKLFPGVVDLLAALTEHGFTLAIASGKSKIGVQRVLDDKPEIAKYISIVCTGDMTESKPHPAMLQWIAAKADVPVQKVMAVGDATLDIQMAHNAKAYGLGVLTGVCDFAALQACNTQFILERAVDLKNYL